MTKGTTVASLGPEIRFLGNAYLIDAIGIVIGIVAVAIMGYNSFNQRKLRAQYGLAIPPAPVE